MKIYYVWKDYCTDDGDSGADLLKVFTSFEEAKNWLLEQHYNITSMFRDNNDETEEFGFYAKHWGEDLRLFICYEEIEILNEIEFFGKEFIKALLEEPLVTSETIEIIKNIIGMFREE